MVNDATLADVLDVMGKVRTAIESVIEGKRGSIDMAMVVLLAEGHLLLEDVPGVGKTMLAKALGRSIDCTVRRIQFTPDLLPSDVTGVSVYNQRSQQFEFKPGGIFANIVVGDEINRASPKTQSALLESMEERQVTVDGTTHVLERPFMVIATQNPIEMGYPTTASEIDMLNTHGGADPLTKLTPVTDGETVRLLIEAVRDVYVAPAVKQYLVDVVSATRSNRDLRLGASPRSSLHLLRAARAQAALSGREYVLPDDVAGLAGAVLSHRVLPSTEAQLARRSVAEIVTKAVRSVPVPDKR